ncbi:hypothetical protein R1flu_015148 [Riccia fluitans]|uniref:Uncharacterized protein n=1 Tax=Riccia fluitans TaxID=41844 RepID=A0ABD1YL94_9MARC
MTWQSDMKRVSCLFPNSSGSGKMSGGRAVKVVCRLHAWRRLCKKLLRSFWPARSASRTGGHRKPESTPWTRDDRCQLGEEDQITPEYTLRLRNLSGVHLTRLTAP